MRKIICKIFGHKRGNTSYGGLNKEIYIECKRCGYNTYYKSPHARLVGEEQKLGFDGN